MTFVIRWLFLALEMNVVTRVSVLLCPESSVSVDRLVVSFVQRADHVRWPQAHSPLVFSQRENSSPCGTCVTAAQAGERESPNWNVAVTGPDLQHWTATFVTNRGPRENLSLVSTQSALCTDGDEDRYSPLGWGKVCWGQNPGLQVVTISWSGYACHWITFAQRQRSGHSGALSGEWSLSGQWVRATSALRPPASS